MHEKSTHTEGLWQSLQNPCSYHLKRVAYVSRATRSFSTRDLEDIEAKSVIANNEQDITGLLFFHERKILQVLEGAPEAVDALIVKISQDPRHTDFKIFSETHIDERMLVKWSMVMRGTGSTPKDLLDAFLTRYDTFRTTKEHIDITLEDINTLKEIALFSTLPVFS